METFFLNMFFGGKLKSMPAKLQSDDGKQIVIRPLAYVKEADLTRYAEVKQFPIIPCDLCGSQENLQRKQIKGMLRDWEKKFPGRVENIFSSLSTVAPSRLMDRNPFGFTELKASGIADPNGDIALMMILARPRNGHIIPLCPWINLVDPRIGIPPDYIIKADQQRSCNLLQTQSDGAVAWSATIRRSSMAGSYVLKKSDDRLFRSTK